MNKKNGLLIMVTCVTALLTFACLGGAAVTPTSVPPQTTQPAQVPTAEVAQVAQNDDKLDITSATSYVDSFNDYNVSGEIFNNTNKALENITLSVSITDSDGKTLLKDENDNPVDSVEVQPYIGVLVPGASSPFNYYISADDVTPAKFEVSIKDYDESDAPDLADVTIANVNFGKTAGGDIVLSGEVINKSSEHVEVESLAGAIMDGDKKVLAANSTLTYSRYLYPAGDSEGRDRSPFIVHFYGPIENMEHWKVYARGVDNSNAPSTSMEVQIMSYYVDTYGTYHLLGTVKNNGTDQISPSVIAGLYTPEDSVFDAASLNVPLYLNAGESAPFDINTFQLVGSLTPEQVSSAKELAQPDLYWTFTTSYDVVSLQAKNLKLTRDDADWTVTGKVTNTSKQKLISISAVVEFLDDNGSVLATNSVSVYPPDGSDTIEPGTSNNFEVSIYAPEDWDLSSQNYQVIVQGVVSQ